MIKKLKNISGIILFLIFFGTAFSGLENGDFELNDPNDGSGFLKPKYWEIYNYAAIQSSFAPHPEYEQQRDPNWVGWTIESAKKGRKFVVLSTGDMDPFLTDQQVSFAYIRQSYEFKAYSKMRGYYFFGTCDYPPYSDWATIRLVPDPNHNPDKEAVEVFRVGVDDVGKFGSSGWKEFEVDLGRDVWGKYDVEFQINDGRDLIYKSYFALDVIQICEPLRNEGDFNLDCRVDIYDFEILAQFWMETCKDINDPNFIKDPNVTYYCNMADANKDKVIDSEDFFAMVYRWLESLWE